MQELSSVQNEKNNPRRSSGPTTIPDPIPPSGSSAGSGARIATFQEMWDKFSADEQAAVRSWLWLQPDELRCLLDGSLNLAVMCPKCKATFSLAQLIPGTTPRMMLRTMACDDCRCEFTADYIAAIRLPDFSRPLLELSSRLQIHHE